MVPTPCSQANLAALLRASACAVATADDKIGTLLGSRMPEEVGLEEQVRPKMAAEQRPVLNVVGSFAEGSPAETGDRRGRAGRKAAIFMTCPGSLRYLPTLPRPCGRFAPRAVAFIASRTLCRRRRPGLAGCRRAHRGWRRWRRSRCARLGEGRARARSPVARRAA